MKKTASTKKKRTAPIQSDSDADSDSQSCSDTSPPVGKVKSRIVMSDSDDDEISDSYFEESHKTVVERKQIAGMIILDNFCIG